MHESIRAEIPGLISAVGLRSDCEPLIMTFAAKAVIKIANPVPGTRKITGRR